MIPCSNPPCSRESSDSQSSNWHPRRLHSSDNGLFSSILRFYFEQILMFSSADLLSKFSITGFRFRNNVPFVPDFQAIFHWISQFFISARHAPQKSQFVRKKSNIFITINAIVCIVIRCYKFFQPTFLHHKSSKSYPQFQKSLDLINDIYHQKSINRYHFAIHIPNVFAENHHFSSWDLRGTVSSVRSPCVASAAAASTVPSPMDGMSCAVGLRRERWG